MVVDTAKTPEPILDGAIVLGPDPKGGAARRRSDFERPDAGEQEEDDGGPTGNPPPTHS